MQRVAPQSVAVRVPSARLVDQRAQMRRHRRAAQRREQRAVRRRKHTLQHSPRSLLRRAHYGRVRETCAADVRTPRNLEFGRANSPLQRFAGGARRATDTRIDVRRERNQSVLFYACATRHKSTSCGKKGLVRKLSYVRLQRVAGARHAKRLLLVQRQQGVRVG